MNLEKIRKEKRLSQKEVSKILNITQGSYSNYESGKREPDIATLIKLSELFHTSIDNLLKDNQDKINTNSHPKYQEDLINMIEQLNMVECAKVEAYVYGLLAGKEEYEQQKQLNKIKGEQ